MNRLLTCTAVALLLSIAPALAENQSDAASGGHRSSFGRTDTSSGAAQSTSTPPGSMSPSKRARAQRPKRHTVPPSGSPDKSSGAAQSTSTPPKSGSSSDDPSAGHY